MITKEHKEYLPRGSGMATVEFRGHSLLGTTRGQGRGSPEEQEQLCLEGCSRIKVEYRLAWKGEA